MVSVRHLSLSVAIILLLTPPPSSSCSSLLSRVTLSFFHRRLQSTIYSVHGDGVLRPSSTPLTIRIHFILSHPERLSSTLSSPTAHFPHPPFAHRHDYRIFFHLRTCPFGMSYLPSYPRLFVGQARSFAISYRHPCATLRR